MLLVRYINFYFIQTNTCYKYTKLYNTSKYNYVFNHKNNTFATQEVTFPYILKLADKVFPYIHLNSPIFMLSFIRRSLSLGLILNLNTLPDEDLYSMSSWESSFMARPIVWLVGIRISGDSRSAVDDFVK